MSASAVNDFNDTIVALATPRGVGAIGIVRLSGPRSIDIANGIFKGKDLSGQASHTIHFGKIVDGESIVDEVLVSLFIAPRSFTKEDVVEISTHGSPFILEKVVKLLLKNGARLAKAGEFTQRAFLNGQFDLAQAEAVADLINSDSEATHMAAMHQMRGGFSRKIKALREELIHFASMIELELDFAEEDVEFASRAGLTELINNLQKEIAKLIESFTVGNVIKNGVPTVIAGKPNAGKSTLLNTLLEEEKAIVSDIPGTTRDFIEDEIHIDGISFRFIDTAGIREARDKIEAIGIERTKARMKAASVIIYLVDLCKERAQEIREENEKLQAMGIPYLLVGNKSDKLESSELDTIQKQFPGMICISASDEWHIDQLKQELIERIHLGDFKTGDTIVTNLRHIDGLTKTQAVLDDVLQGIGNQVTGDFLAMDLRQALHHLGEITGEITTEDLLGNIFNKFCIGK
ncbi:MAG: tRNA uridine-5-carboxymethylaminomethyl(34) synthesis GTPase MnmE [Cytophagales bacterium]|nr:tRNA uridine-5-carboxymethylaminomethyl(34) synthesis GTPase MnmE [Cytophagales bacterium]